MKPANRLSTLLGALLATGTLASQHGLAAQMGGARDSIRVVRVAEGIVAADNRRDLDAVLGFYAPGAVLFPPGEEPVVGLDRIRPRYVGLFEGFDPEIVPTVDEVVVRGDLAIVRGRNGGALRGRSGAADRILNDVYLMVLRRDGSGTWRISRLMWHSGGQGG